MPPDDYEGWLRRYFGSYVTAALAPHHHDFWRWAWGVGEQRDDVLGRDGEIPADPADGILGHDPVASGRNARRNEPDAAEGITASNDVGPTSVINGRNGYSAKETGEDDRSDKRVRLQRVSPGDGRDGGDLPALFPSASARPVVGGSSAGSHRPFVAIWPRGGAKSTSAELAVVAMAARRRRRYCLYVSRTQEQADDHVGNIGSMLTGRDFAEHYADCADRAVTKFGASRGWRRNRLHTASGFVCDALGLDTAARGAKVDEQRPDLIILDDIDKPEDTIVLTEKIQGLITKAILPAGSNDVAILAIQNLVHPDGVFARLASDAPPFLSQRIRSGPVPAVWDAGLDGNALISGLPTWSGQSLVLCQRQIDEWGLDAWLAEAQHEVGLQARVGLVLGEDPDDGVLILDPRENVCEAQQRWADCLWRVVSIDPGGGDPGGMAAVGVSHRALPIALKREGTGVEVRPSHLYETRRFLNGASLNDVHRQLQAWHGQGAIDAVYVGETGGDTLVRSLQSLGWPAEKANMDRSQITYLQERFKSRLLTVSPKAWPDVEREAGSYWWKAQRPGSNQPVNPYATETGAGHHADIIDCLRYAEASVKDGLPGKTRQFVGQVGRGMVRLGQVGRAS